MIAAKNLVIGYGNSLRCDDGVGVRVAEMVADWHLPKVRSLAVTQLTPELAQDLAGVDSIIFVDACQAVDTDTVEVCALKPLATTQLHSHFGDPRALLSLTLAIYGKCPQAWWVIIPATNFQLGESLSSLAKKGIALALIQIRAILNGNCQTMTTATDIKYNSCTK
ncbi:hydrogenase maturation protease [Myxosarcina sp. GI1]|uniref:hydrogenase maturation protease n=1 Tax=Myxosarcina sp. GI1 TaxID=1541065 RepID=UPI000689CFC1|nr:hydrogenase maturation protease [Myxosarcina sp. GI1]